MFLLIDKIICMGKVIIRDSCSWKVMTWTTTYGNKLKVSAKEQYKSFFLTKLSCLFGCSGRIPRLSLIQHSLYVWVVEKLPPPPLAGEQYGKMEQNCHCLKLFYSDLPIWLKTINFSNSFLNYNFSYMVLNITY